MLTIQYASDLHLECWDDKSKMPHNIITKSSYADILVLCGDIGDPKSELYRSLIYWCSKQYKYVLLIAGNLEYYQINSNMDEINSIIQTICKQYTNVFFLNQSYIIIDNVKYIGMTLWSIINQENCEGINYNKVFLNCIPDMDTLKFNELHISEYLCLQKCLCLDDKIPTIIITHHMPYKDNLSDCLALLNMANVKAWFFGHIHQSVLYDVEKDDGNIVKFRCNARGFANSFNNVFENDKYDEQAIVSIN